MKSRRRVNSDVMRFLIHPMNTSRALMALVFLSLPLTAAGRALQPCDKAHLHYRNLESQAITKVSASYPNEPGVRVKGKVVVLIKVDRSGNVYYAHVLCGHPLLASSSVAAAFRWKFSPRRVNRVGIITFEFAPNDGVPERISASK
jgi:outer membrane biosynthesis protein TonB